MIPLAKLGLKYGKKGWDATKKFAKDINIDGPDSRSGRLCQVRYKKRPFARLDYHPYDRSHAGPRLHGHLPTLLPNVKHIPLDPRSIFDE